MLEKDAPSSARIHRLGRAPGETQTPDRLVICVNQLFLLFFVNLEGRPHSSFHQVSPSIAPPPFHREFTVSIRLHCPLPARQNINALAGNSPKSVARMEEKAGQIVVIANFTNKPSIPSMQTCDLRRRLWHSRHQAIGCHLRHFLPIGLSALASHCRPVFHHGTVHGVTRLTR